MAEEEADRVRQQKEEEATAMAEEEALKQKQSEELKKEEEQKKKESAAAAQEKQKREDERKRLRDAVAGDVGSGGSEKKARVDECVVATVARVPCDVVLRGSGAQATLHLRNSTETHKKVPKETVLLTWKEDTKLSQESDINFAYELTMQTEIVCRDALKKFRLNKYIKDQQKSTKEVYGYVPFPPGTVPKVLVKKDTKTLFFSTSSATDGKPGMKAAIEAARVSEACSLHWIMKFAPTKERLEPCGLAVVTCKALVVPGGGEVSLSN